MLDAARRLLPTGYEGHSPNDAPYRISTLMEQCLNNSRMIGDWLRDTNEVKLHVSVYPTVETFWDIPKLVTKYNKNRKAIDKEGYIAEYLKVEILYFCIEIKFPTNPPIWLTVSIWIKLKEKVERDLDNLYVKKKLSLGLKEERTRDELKRLIGKLQNKLGHWQSKSNRGLSSALLKRDFPGSERATAVFAGRYHHHARTP